MSAANAVTLFYVISSIVAVLGVAGGLYKLYNRQRERWTQDGEQRAEQSAITERNSSKLEENTSAITALTRELRDFIMNVRIELNGHDGRITRLERWRDAYGRGSSSGSGSVSGSGEAGKLP